MRAKDVVRAIERHGGWFVSQRGSHAKYRAAFTVDGTRHVLQTIVAMHSGDVPTGTLRKIESDREPAFGEGWLSK